MESIHEYRVEAIGAGGRNGVVHAEGILPAISFSPPPEFQGELGRWTPEHFLVAAVASCFISTFEGMAQTSRLEFNSLRLAAEGVLTKLDDSGWRFTEIRLRPTVTLRKEEDHHRAIRLLVIFQDCQPCASDGKTASINGVRQFCLLCAFAAETDICAPRLKSFEVRA